ncbi:MAG: VWA domain-containing protein [Planctomycetota bacterium]
MRSWTPYVLALGLCTACREAPDPAPAPRPLGDKLAGASIEKVSDGAWSLRRAHVAGGGGRGRPTDPDAPASEAAAPSGSATYGLMREAEGSDMPEKRAEVAGKPALDLGEAEADVEAVDEHVVADPAPRDGRADHAAKPSRLAPLRAGSTDDNADYEAFLAFLASCRQAGADTGSWLTLDVAGRRYVRVTDAKGRPCPGAEVRVVDLAEDRVLTTGKVMGDGRLPFYPALAGLAADRRVMVEVALGDARARKPWDGKADLEVGLDVARPDSPVALDVVFLVDTTGSMGDEIDAIKSTLAGVTKKLRSLEREFSLRYGAVLYRDLGDEYVTKAHPFTEDLAAFDSALAGIRADGGGDGPESLNQGLAVAVHGMAWRPDAAKLVFLIADAQPHLDYEDDVPYTATIQDALRLGIKVHAVAASGLDGAGTIVFRQVAQLTRGKFIFIEYGSTEATAASHGVAGKVKSNNLDDILFEQCRDEIAAWGR